MKQRIKNLLNFDPTGLDLTSDQGMREATETQMEIYNLLQSDHDLSVKDENQLTAKSNLLGSKIENAKKKLTNIDGLQTISGDVENFDGKLSGGKPLNKEGTVRMFNAAEKLNNAYGENKVGLGEYLRAVVDKPRNAAEREIIQNSVTSGDYELPTHIAAELIDQLRAVNPLLMENGAGARTISIEGGDTKFIKITGDPTAVWHAEMTEETPSDPTFGSASFSPKTVLAMTEIGRETLQDSANVEEALTTAFVGSLNDAILTATFTGSGANTPSGLATTITETEEYANAGSPDWSNFVNASKTLHDNNVPNDNRSFIHAPDVWQTLALITDDQSRYQDAPSFIRELPNFVSSGVSAGEAYVGDFSNVVYGFRLNITLEQFPSAAAKSYGSLWVAAARLDIATFRSSALVRIEEAAA